MGDGLESLPDDIETLQAAFSPLARRLRPPALGNPTTVLEATGLNFPDALAGGPAAIEDGAAILLTNGKVQAAETSAYLAAHTGGSHFALGGPAAAADPSAVAISAMTASSSVALSRAR